MRIKQTLYLMIVIACIFGGDNAGAAEPGPAVPSAPAVVPAPTPAPPVRRPRATVPKDEREFYISIADYGWREMRLDNSGAMKESGTLFGLGFSYQHEFEDRINLKLGVELFGGSVDYDGSTQAGIPAKSTDNYAGLKLKGDVGRAVALSEKITIKPFAGLGFWSWTRTIEDTIASNGTPAYGYTEDWISFHIRAGAEAAIWLSGSSRIFFEGGLKVPLYNENYAYVGSGVTTNPGKKVSYFAETGFREGMFKGSLFYDGLRFSASDVDPVTSLYQPESISDIVGVKVGVVF